MGQYYVVINLTKGQFISPHAVGDLAKLQELDVTLRAVALLCANSNGRGGGDYLPEKDYGADPFDAKGNFRSPPLTAAGKLQAAAIDTVAGLWAGDRIVFQGDYAKRGDKGYVGKARLAKMTDISDLVSDFFAAMRG